MFTDKDDAKYPSKRQEVPRVGHESRAPQAVPATDQEMRSALAAESSELDGLTIEEYSKKLNVAEAEIWRRLRRGELIGRTEAGRLLIYRSIDAAPAVRGERLMTSPESDVTARDVTPGDASPHAASPASPGDDDLSHLPPLPEVSAEPNRSGAAFGGYLAVAPERANSQELALLIDHLSLAKEENREILRMTQESIRKVTELSDTIVEMKDAVIESKEAVILALKEQLAARDQEIRKLRQQNEDLEMLARAMSRDARSASRD